MKTVKSILKFFAALNWVSCILGIVNVAVWDYLFGRGRLNFWDKFSDILDYPTVYSAFISPFVIIIGAIISLMLILSGLKNPENSLKSECILFAAFVLCTIPVTVIWGYSLLWF